VTLVWHDHGDGEWRFSAVKITEHRCHCGAGGAFGYWCAGALLWFCAEHRLRQWSADACASEADARCARAELRSPEGAPPDLQALVARHGGYHRIPPEEWAQYDEAMASWQARRREKYRRK
jgi:hypothetical protein